MKFAGLSFPFNSEYYLARLLASSKQGAEKSALTGGNPGLTSQSSHLMLSNLFLPSLKTA